MREDGGFPNGVNEKGGHFTAVESTENEGLQWGADKRKRKGRNGGLLRWRKTGCDNEKLEVPGTEQWLWEMRGVNSS